MSFSDGMKRKRKSLKLSQTELAKLSGVPQQTISAIERRDRQPSEDAMCAIAAGLGTTVGELLGETQPTESLTSDEIRLLTDYRALTSQGREYIRQQMFMATSIYKNADLPGLETVNA